jgi:hypothetical protein
MLTVKLSNFTETISGYKLVTGKGFTIKRKAYRNTRPFLDN